MKGIKISQLLLSLVLFGLMAISTLAIPAGPRNLTDLRDERLPIYPTISNNALAGNVTELYINAWSITRSWQGYFGNITGTIVLADQSNNTLYDWSNTNPNGRIYATRNSGDVAWANVRCANATELNEQEMQVAGTFTPDRYGVYSPDSPNLTFVTSFANKYDMPSGAGLNNQYTGMYANYSTFWVGPVQINGTFNSSDEPEISQCYSTVMHNNATWVDGDQNAQNDPNHWRELILSDGTVNGTIYTALLEIDDNQYGFDNSTHDFEMIVPENGRGTDVGITTYYFYVELE